MAKGEAGLLGAGQSRQYQHSGRGAVSTQNLYAEKDQHLSPHVDPGRTLCLLPPIDRGPPRDIAQARRGRAPRGRHSPYQLG